MADGRLLAWESNWSGLLGNTSLAVFERTAQPHPPVPTPTATLPMPKIVDVAAGSTHVVAVTADGTVFAWGNAQAGQLGNGDLPVINFKSGVRDTTYYVPFPTQVAGLADVVSIAAGSKFSLALLKDGSIRAWGENQHGQLGDGTTQARLRPVAVRGITNAVAVSPGGLDYAAALLADGTVLTW
jgi:alpha-tubulin suppressor-like RCC1 family protein